MDCTICVAKTKALISLAVTAKLIRAFVFAYAKKRFSHDAAHISFSDCCTAQAELSLRWVFWSYCFVICRHISFIQNNHFENISIVFSFVV